MERIGIIGAGAAGAAAAYALRDEPYRLAVFEKSRGFSGRAATRRRGEVCYDHGANYFHADSERVQRIVRQELSLIGLARIDGDVWTFDKDGTVSEGDADGPDKWTYRTGIHRLGKRMALASEADLHLETRITHLREEDDGRWRLIDQDANEHGAFNSVLLTPPAPQSAELLRASETLAADVQPLVEALEAVPYRAQLTVVLGYEERLDRPGSFYGLVNTDSEHDVAWLSFEEDKAGHVPDGQSVLIAQMSPDWSAPHLDEVPDEYVEDAARAVATLLDDESAADPAWTDVQRWRYALPEESADAEALEAGASLGLYVAGDALAGEGRVQSALETGLDVAERMSAHEET